MMAVQNPVFFLARERNLAEEAWPGDIIGIPNHGTLRIGDTLTEGEAIRVTGIPNFAPEILRRVRLEDPMKSKHLRHALEQLAEEGVTRVFKPLIGGDWIVGVVGAAAARRAGGAASRPNTSSASASSRRPTRRRAGSTPTTAPSSSASSHAQPLGRRRGPRRRAGLSRAQRLGPRHDHREWPASASPPRASRAEHPDAAAGSARCRCRAFSFEKAMQNPERAYAEHTVATL